MYIPDNCSQAERDPEHCHVTKPNLDIGSGFIPAYGQRIETGWHRHATLLINGKIMLYTIAVVLLILWLLGLVTSYTIGGFIHILLVVAVVMILVRLISGRGI